MHVSTAYSTQGHWPNFRRFDIRLAIFFVTMLISLPSTLLADISEAVWSETQKANCQIWNSTPHRDETVTWSGSCSVGKADGAGRAEWHYKDPRGKPLTQTYDGTLLAGRFAGQGVINYGDGGSYKGSFLDGERSGHGVLILKDAGRLEGEFKNDKISGHGSATYFNGAHYEGDFVDGKYSGRGKYTTQKGASYEGEFKFGLPFGVGKCVTSSGKTIKCIMSGGYWFPVQ